LNILSQKLHKHTIPFSDFSYYREHILLSISDLLHEYENMIFQKFSSEHRYKTILLGKEDLFQNPECSSLAKNALNIM